MEMYHHGIKGQKWGIRRYQNEDGTLTPEGRKRYERDVRENNMKKKDSRAVIDGPDPNRWVKEDLTRSKKAIDAGSELVTKFKNLEQSSAAKHIDLSKMSDKELRDLINRKQLEQQYAKLYADVPQAQVSKGRAIVKDTLEVAGNVLTVAGTAISIAVAIKELKG